MRIALSFILIISLTTGSLKAQFGTFTDERDGNVYETVRIGNRTWLREHLRLKTSGSYFPNQEKDTSSLHLGNYYSYTELDSVCPKGWHLASTTELEEYIQFIATLYKIPGSAINRHDSKDADSSFMITLPNFNPESDTLLQLYSIGWVEGRKIHSDKSLSLWLKDTKTFDNKFHAHIGRLGYIIHTHEHNIIDKPRLVRKFPVRCICNE